MTSTLPPTRPQTKPSLHGSPTQSGLEQGPARQALGGLCAAAALPSVPSEEPQGEVMLIVKVLQLKPDSGAKNAVWNK